MVYRAAWAPPWSAAQTAPDRRDSASSGSAPGRATRRPRPGGTDPADLESSRIRFEPLAVAARASRSEPLAVTAGLLYSRIVQESRDRKSTRLNSSHLGISYAVF